MHDIGEILVLNLPLCFFYFLAKYLFYKGFLYFLFLLRIKILHFCVWCRATIFGMIRNYRSNGVSPKNSTSRYFHTGSGLDLIPCGAMIGYTDNFCRCLKHFIRRLWPTFIC